MCKFRKFLHISKDSWRSTFVTFFYEGGFTIYHCIYFSLCTVQPWTYKEPKMSMVQQSCSFFVWNEIIFLFFLIIFYYYFYIYFYKLLCCKFKWTVAINMFFLYYSTTISFFSVNLVPTAICLLLKKTRPFRLVFFRRDIWPWGRGCLSVISLCFLFRFSLIYIFFYSLHQGTSLASLISF